MAAYAEEILLFAVPASCSLAVEPRFPVAQDRAVALPAQDVRFLEFDLLAVCEPEFVPVVRIVAVKAPPARHVFQNDVLMHAQLALFPVSRHA